MKAMSLFVALANKACSNCLESQGQLLVLLGDEKGYQDMAVYRKGCWSRTIAFRMTRNLRIQAVMATFGGYIPQQYRKIVVEREDLYFIVTLYALGLHATEGDISQIVQLNPEDISLFDNMVTPMQIP